MGIILDSVRTAMLALGQMSKFGGKLRQWVGEMYSETATHSRKEMQPDAAGILQGILPKELYSGVSGILTDTTEKKGQAVLV